MADSQKTSSSTTEVLTRVEGTDEFGRPRVLRCFYPEDYYSKSQDTRDRKHMSVQVDAKDVAKTAPADKG